MTVCLEVTYPCSLPGHTDMIHNFTSFTDMTTAIEYANWYAAAVVQTAPHVKLELFNMVDNTYAQTTFYATPTQET